MDMKDRLPEDHIVLPVAFCPICQLVFFPTPPVENLQLLCPHCGVVTLDADIGVSEEMADEMRDQAMKDPPHLLALGPISSMNMITLIERGIVDTEVKDEHPTDNNS